MSSHHPATPVALLGGLFLNRELLWELVKRDFIGRYKGSMLGVVWSLFNPLLMLAIYTFVFSLAIGLKVCQVGYWWFQKSRRGFADVL